MQTKLLNLERCRIKSSDGDARTFEGYASVFGNVDAQGDIVLPGAFSKTLENRERPVRMRWNHFGPIIGKWLDIKEDDIGLWVKGELTPNHSVANDVSASMLHGSVDGMSIGYFVTDSETTGKHNLLKEIELIEISIVEEPANIMATVGDIKASDLDGMNFDTLAESEKFLRLNCGMSGKAATAFVSKVKAIEEARREAVVKTKTNQRVAAICAAIERI